MIEDKNCVVCGRRITYRKKWEKNWDEIKYCSEQCRRQKSAGAPDEAAILDLLGQRAAGKTICPSEILPDAEKKNHERMEQVRQAARRLVHAGRIEITQGGRVVDPSDFRGPIRLRLVRPK